MNEQSGADSIGSLPAPSQDGEPIAEYIARTVKADFRTRIQEDGHSTTVQARLWRAFRPAVFSLDVVQRFYDAYDKIDRNVDASWYERELHHLWQSHNPAALPLSVRKAAIPQPDLRDTPRVTVTLVGRFRQLTALFEAARTRDLLLAQFCDSLRQGKLQAVGFLADDYSMDLKLIPPGRWDDSAMMCAWREGELRPRDEAPKGTPYYRGLRIMPALIKQTPNEATAPDMQLQAVKLAAADGYLPRSPVTKELQSWYEDRYREWPGDLHAPGKAKDWEDAQIHWIGRSPKPTRDAVYMMRAKIAPDWKPVIGRPTKRPKK